MSLETDVSADLVARPTGPLLLRGELVPGGPLEIVGMTWNMGEGPPVDGMLMRIEKLVGDGTPSLAWAVVMPPSPTGFNEVRFPQLPADLVPVWAGRLAGHLVRRVPPRRRAAASLEVAVVAAGHAGQGEDREPLGVRAQKEPAQAIDSIRSSDLRFWTAR